jgi:hypothetical protein
MGRVTKVTKSLLPFDMSDVDGAVESGVVDHNNPVFVPGSPENTAARAQALIDQESDKSAALAVKVAADHDAEAKRKARLKVLGNVAGGDFGGPGSNFI